MVIVDTHCHVGLHKYEPVESLLYQMDTNGVAKAVFIQYMGNTDNGYMLDCAAGHPGRFQAAMVVGHSDDGTRVREWAEKGIVGIRLPADARAESADPLSQWRAAADLGLVVSAPCNPQSLLGQAFDEVVRTFPDLHVVIEHLGGAGQRKLAVGARAGREDAQVHCRVPAPRRQPAHLWPARRRVPTGRGPLLATRALRRRVRGLLRQGSRAG